MQEKVASLRQELFNMRFQHKIGQLENPKKLMFIKRDIARVMTIMNEPRTS
jgi:large subunit ribosomal protein L29